MPREVPQAVFGFIDGLDGIDRMTVLADRIGGDFAVFDPVAFREPPELSIGGDRIGRTPLDSIRVPE